MSTPRTAASHDLVLTRQIDAAPSEVYRAWTNPDLLKQWFAPAPWTTPEAELDVRPGGSNLIVMRSPDGDDMPNRGVYLEVVENERLVFTDAYTEAWVPSEKPFMTVVLTFEASRPGGRSALIAPTAVIAPMARGAFILRACGTGARQTGSPTRRWGFTRVGDCAPTSSRRWSPGEAPRLTRRSAPPRSPRCRHPRGPAESAGCSPAARRSRSTPGHRSGGRSPRR